MDLDAFVTVHRDEWARLDTLSRRRALSGEEADELVALYQAAATHLSMVRSAAPDPALLSSLSTTVARGRAAVTGSSEPLLRELARLFTVSFPVAVYRARWWTAGAAALTVVLAAAAGAWVFSDPQAVAAMGTDAQRRRLVEIDFEGYYSEYAATSFAAQVWTNNAWVAALCIALGISGIGVLWVLVNNAVNVGLIAGLMAHYDRLPLFFGLILPHGLLELTCVFMAAGAGLKLFWAWVDPGPRRRATALSSEGRSMVVVAVGLVPTLLVSGVLEAFVTPSPLPTWARITVGAVVWALFLTYVGVLGRRGVATGETGDVRAGLAGDVAPVAG